MDELDACARLLGFGLFDSCAEVAELDVQSGGDAPDRCPCRVGLAALDAGQGSDGDAGVVGEVFLGVVAILAQATQRGCECWVDLGGWGH